MQQKVDYHLFISNVDGKKNSTNRIGKVDDESKVTEPNPVKIGPVYSQKKHEPISYRLVRFPILFLCNCTNIAQAKIFYYTS